MSRFGDPSGRLLGMAALHLASVSISALPPWLLTPNKYRTTNNIHFS
jgi:hypothetical protein